MTNSVWEVRELSADDWQLLRQARLDALADSPQAFLAEHHLEESWGKEEWRGTFATSRWLVAETPDVIGLLRSIRDPGIPSSREIQSVWVAPIFRKRGVFRSMLRALAKRESAESAEPVSDLWLWVMEDNQDAQQVYERLGFTVLGAPQPLPGSANRLERRMRLGLTG